jgi:hypothetical protein
MTKEKEEGKAEETIEGTIEGPGTAAGGRRWASDGTSIEF